MAILGINICIMPEAPTVGMTLAICLQPCKTFLDVCFNKLLDNNQHSHDQNFCLMAGALKSSVVYKGALVSCSLLVVRNVSC